MLLSGPCQAQKIFFGDSAQDVFGTVLHEDYHWYNALDPEGARRLQDHALLYLAEKNGYEDIDALIRARMGDYAAQRLTYEQAAEELVADAWGGIFDSEESFRQWAQFQRSQAEKNAGRAGNIHRVMEQVKDLLDNILQKAREVLRLDPENTAARRAQRLAEAEKRALQEEYFAHAEQAMENLRAAKENAAAPGKERAAEKAGVRYQIDPEYAENIERWDKAGRAPNKVFTLGTTGDTLQRLGAQEKSIYMQGNKIQKIMNDHPEMTLEEIKRIPEILEDPALILTSQNKGRTKQNTRLVMFGDVKAQDGRPVMCILDLRPVENHIVINDMQKVTSAYTKDVNPVEFVRKSKVLYLSENKKRTTELFRTLGFKMPSELQLSGSIGTITYKGQNVKLDGVEFTDLEAKESPTDEPVQKTRRFQLSSPVEVNGEKELVAVHNLTEENLQEALELGGMPSPSIAVVKARDGHSKYGPVSLVFRPDSIDPQASRANRVYGSDAWTPTRPGVEYEVNDRAAERFETMVSKASEAAFEGKFRSYSALRSMTADDTSQWTRAELAQKLSGQTAVQLAYLAEKGIRVDPEYKAVQQEYDSFGQDALDKLLARENSIEQVCMGACAEQKQKKILTIHAVNEQPIRPDMALTETNIVSYEGMIPVLIWQ